MIGYITLGLGVLVLLLSVWCELVTRMQVFAELGRYINDATQLDEMKRQFGHSRLMAIGLRWVLGLTLIALGTAIVYDHKWHRGILGYCSCAIAFLTAGLMGAPILLALLLLFLYFKTNMRSVAKILSLITAGVCLFLGIVPTSNGYNVSHFFFLALAAIFGFSFIVMEKKAKAPSQRRHGTR